MLVRDGAGGRVEVYLTRRNARSRFMPDAFVFPGGAVDAADRSIAAKRVRGNAGRASAEFVVAAVRETFEEAGVLLASTAGGEHVALTASELASARAALLAGAGFEALLEARELAIDASRLIYYSNWVTPATEPIRFDAHFFAALAPPDQFAAADAIEVHEGRWLAPEEALAQAERGAMTVRFPTRKHLARIARFENVADFFAHAREREIRPVEPVERGPDNFLLDDDAW
jgi:8-oxo-dGTP pyrophosphatase MutT (NUDIX family)